MNFNNTIKNVNKLAENLKKTVRIMEVCGSHTMSAFRSGLRSLLPSNVKLLSGPGCPVCVTSNDYLDWAIAIANQRDVITVTFGDMIKVPAGNMSLERAKAMGADIRIAYSPTFAIELAKNNPNKKVVFLGVGFETTTPTVAYTIKEAYDIGLKNYSVLCAHKVMPPPMDALLSAGVNIDAFLCPGHVSVITGAKIYEFIAKKYKIPCVVSGFEPPDMLEAIELALMQIINGEPKVEIQYKRSVNWNGNLLAQELINEVLKPSDANWRGVGIITNSGMCIKEKYSEHDAFKVFNHLTPTFSKENKGCRCGEILRGIITPIDCPLFEKTCTPDSPIGACMVSSEGTCAAYYKYSKRKN